MDVLDAVFPAMVLYFYFKWTKTKKNIYLFLIFFILAIAINNHAATIYFVVSTQIWFFYLLFKKVIKFKTYLIAFLIFLITMFPYFNALILSNVLTAKTPQDIYSAFSFSYEQSLGFLRSKYSAESILEFSEPYLVNFFNPELFIVKLSELLIPFEFYNLSYFAVVILILIIPIDLFFRIKNRDEDIKFLIYQTYAVLLIAFFSIVPITGPTYFFGFFVAFVCLLAKELTVKNRVTQVAIIAIFIILFLTNVASSISRINMKSYEQLEQVWPKNVTRLIVDGVVYESLKYVSNFKPLNVEDLRIFECRHDGIYSVSSDSIGYYSHENSTARLDSNFFIKQNLTEGDIIIFSVECIYNSRVNGFMNVTVAHGLNNNYTKIYSSIESIADIEGIIIYKVL